VENEPILPDIPEPVSEAPAELVISTNPGTVLAQNSNTQHGWHSGDVIRIPTSLSCNLCPLYHVKKKDKRHSLACKEGRKNQICPILTRLQQEWAFGLINEIRDAAGVDPTSSDNARIEQIVRHRSRIFQIENYLKVAGLIDLVRGEIRNVADRVVTTENALGRALSDFRQAVAERKATSKEDGPKLADYLQQIQTKGEDKT